MNLLPSDVKKLVGQYREENQFLELFVNEYYSDNVSGNDIRPPLNNNIKEILEISNLKSKLITKKRRGIYDVKFVINGEDIIDVNIIKQFILLILPHLFNVVLAYDDWDWFSE